LTRLRVASALRFMPAAIVARRRASSARSHSANQVGGDASVGLSCGARVNPSPWRVVVLGLQRTVQSSSKLRLASSAYLATMAMYPQRYIPVTQAANFYLPPRITASARLGARSVDIREQRGVQVRWPPKDMATVAKIRG
jgi:hypothetical protein